MKMHKEVRSEELNTTIDEESIQVNEKIKLQNKVLKKMVDNLQGQLNQIHNKDKKTKK